VKSGGYESIEEYEDAQRALTAGDIGKQVIASASRLPDRRESIVIHNSRVFSFLNQRRRHAGCSFDNFVVTEESSEVFEKAKRYAEDVRRNVSKGSNIIAVGDSGTGKDHIVMAIAKAAYSAGLWVEEISGPDLKSSALEVMRTGRVSDIVDRLTSSDALWISDPLVGGDASPFYAELLYLLVDTMYRKVRPVWVTVNASDGGNVAMMLGPPVYDRLRHNAIRLKFTWSSYRGPLDA